MRLSGRSRKEGFSESGKGVGQLPQSPREQANQEHVSQCQVALRTQGGQRACVCHELNICNHLISASDIQHPKP